MQSKLATELSKPPLMSRFTIFFINLCLWGSGNKTCEGKRETTFGRVNCLFCRWAVGSTPASTPPHQSLVWTEAGEFSLMELIVSGLQKPLKDQNINDFSWGTK